MATHLGLISIYNEHFLPADVRVNHLALQHDVALGALEVIPKIASLIDIKLVKDGIFSDKKNV